MSEWKEVYKVVLAKTKETYEAEKSFILKMSLILTFLAVVSTALGMFDLQGQGAGFMESISPGEYKDVLGNPLYTYSIDTIVVMGFIGLINTIMYFVNLVYLYNRIQKNTRTLSDSAGHFAKKFFPLLFTSIIAGFLLVCLYILLIVPGVIFTILWMFFIYAVLFRNKNFYSALKYSRSLVGGRKMMTINNMLGFAFNQYKLWLLPFLGIFVLIMFFPNTYAYLFGVFVVTVFYNIFYLRTLTFNVNYFLALEDMNKGVSVGADLKAEDIPKPNSDVELSQKEINAKNYIEQYKSQFPRESIKTALVNTGIASAEVDVYLDKYF